MPHSTSSGADRLPPLGRVKSYNDTNGTAANGLEKFPDLDPLPEYLAHDGGGAPQKWLPRRESNNWRLPAPGGAPRGSGHGRQKSLSQAIRTIRTRNGSLSQNVHEITDALKAPVSGRLIVRCAGVALHATPFRRRRDTDIETRLSA